MVVYNSENINDKNIDKVLKGDANSSTEKNNARNTPRIITIASGKGGVGKTNLAINLAISFHRMGKKVLVMDADLGLANVNIILGIVPKYNLYNVLKGQKTLKEIVIDTPYGIKIIAGASGFYQLANLDNDKRMAFINSLIALRSADIIIIDTGAGVSFNVISFLLAADDMIIITTPEPTAITDAYGIIKSIASAGGSEKRIKLVVNKVDKEIKGKKIADRVINIATRFLNVEIDNIGYIFDDEIVPKSVNRQKPFLYLAPKSKASICVDNIARRLVEVQEEEKPKGLKKFIKTLFGTS
ncbi:MAG: MinD/ParA family protein [Spirochaetota bacterium]